MRPTGKEYSVAKIEGKMMGTMDQPMARADVVTVLCPTAFEATRVRAALGGVGCAAQVRCIGVGAHAVTRWAAQERARGGVLPARGAIVLLAGLAGGLRPPFVRGSVWCASKVVSSDGRVFHPTVGAAGAPSAASACVASVERVVGSRAQKEALHARTGCDLVDVESGGFCEMASALGWRFGIVRGVSDGVADELPAWMTALVGVDGSLVGSALIRALLASPLRAVMLARAGALCSRVLARVGGAAAHLAVAATTRRTLLFGGTFDPPHRMHVRMAVDAARVLGCARIVVVPAGRAPLRAAGDHGGATREQRLAMVRLAFSQVPGAEVDAFETQREGESFTVETLAFVAARDRLTRADLVLLIGADQAMQFDRWHSWRRISDELAHVAVVPRPPWDARSLANALREKFAALGCDGDAWARAVLPMPAIPLAATEVRAQWRGDATRALAATSDLLDPAVARFIRERRLYQGAESPAAPTMSPHARRQETHE